MMIVENKERPKPSHVAQFLFVNGLSAASIAVVWLMAIFYEAACTKVPLKLGEVSRPN
jgi:hypothetical protein